MKTITICSCFKASRVFKVLMVMRSFKFDLFCSKLQAAGAYSAA